MDVKLDQIMVNEPVCTSETGNEEDAKLVCDNLIIKLIHYDLTGNDLGNLPLLNIGEELLASKSMHMEDHYTVSDAYGLFVQLDESLEKVPSSNVTVSNLGIKMKYVQK